MHVTTLRTLSALALLLATSAGCFSGRQATSDDARISDEIRGALHTDRIDEVTVDVANGHVRLSGSATAEQIERAVFDAERVDGVRSVKSTIRASHEVEGIRRNHGG
ncbi:MAG: BON domain-containing protein [Acidobacteriota bacterium]|nr:BON domain-containing protein [Acidobacteriota bacterium]